VQVRQTEVVEPAPAAVLHPPVVADDGQQLGVAVASIQPAQRSELVRDTEHIGDGCGIFEHHGLGQPREPPDPLHAPGRGCQDACQHAQESGLARPIAPDESDALGRQLQVDPIEDGAAIRRSPTELQGRESDHCAHWYLPGRLPMSGL
jgi:hypothetical protein